MQTQTSSQKQPVRFERTLTRKQVAKIPLTEEEHQKLIQPPRASLERLRNATQNADDWYIVTFRVRVGLMAADREYSDEVKQALVEADRITREMHAMYLISDKYNWACTPGQVSILEQALDLVDEIQRHTSRETLMFCTKKVYAVMIKYVA